MISYNSSIFLFIKIVPKLNWLQMVFVTMNQIIHTAILMVAIVPQTYLPQPKLQLQELVVPQPLLLQIQQRLEDATLDGLVMHSVMISTTIWNVPMMEETAVDPT